MRKLSDGAADPVTGWLAERSHAPSWEKQCSRRMFFVHKCCFMTTESRSGQTEPSSVLTKRMSAVLGTRWLRRGKFSAVQMIDVRIPTNDGRELALTRYTQREPDLKLLLYRLKLVLLAQPPPKKTPPPRRPPRLPRSADPRGSPLEE